MDRTGSRYMGMTQANTSKQDEHRRWRTQSTVKLACSPCCAPSARCCWRSAETAVEGDHAATPKSRPSTNVANLDGRGSWSKHSRWNHTLGFCGGAVAVYLSPDFNFTSHDAHLIGLLVDDNPVTS